MYLLQHASELLFPGPRCNRCLAVCVETPSHKQGLFHPLGPVDGKIASQEHLLNGDLREVAWRESLESPRTRESVISDSADLEDEQLPCGISEGVLKVSYREPFCAYICATGCSEHL